MASCVTPSSILKSPNYPWGCDTSPSGIKQQNRVRFRLHQIENLEEIFVEVLKGTGICKEYNNVLVMLRDAQLADADLRAILQEATTCISLITSNLRLFVEAILYIDWIRRDEVTVQQYQSFIVNLLSAHTYHVESTINRIVALFVTDRDCIDENQPETFNSYGHIHTLLRLLLEVVPMCRDPLKQALISQFPYMKRSPTTHKFYIHNLLRIIEYEPIFQTTILNLIVSKLIKMDLRAPKENILKVDDLEDQQADLRSVTTTSSTPESLASTMNTLDICMEKLFTYLIEKCHLKVPPDESSWKCTKTLYQDMLLTFDMLILPTENTHHVQFLLFLMCSFKLTLCESFVAYLWKTVCNPNKGPVLRQAAINYLASLLVRANYLPLVLLKSTLQQICDWVQQYIQNQNSVHNSVCDYRIHSVFFSTCQAIFYIVIHRYRDLISTKKNLIFLNSLNLTKIITCQLNPLKICHPLIVQRFAAITRKYQVAYCYTIIEHNSREILPCIYRDKNGSIISVSTTTCLDSSYPFDPYILTLSADKIEAHYRNCSVLLSATKLSSPDSDFTTTTTNMDVDSDDFLQHSNDAY